ncbi:MAG: ATP-binding protein [Burkholderiaceae bacterium]
MPCALRANSLRVRQLRFTVYFAVALALTALVPLTVLTTLQLAQIDRDRSVAEQQQMRQAQVLAREVEAYLGDHHRAVLALAQQLKQSPTRREVESLLRTVYASLPGFRSVFLLDASGRMVAGHHPSRPSPIGADYSDRPYVQKTSELRQPVVSSIRNGRNITSELLVVLTAPILHSDGSIRHILIAPLALKTLWSVIESKEFGRGAHAVVSDTIGNAVFFPGIGLNSVPLSIASEPIFSIAREHKHGQATHFSTLDRESVFTTYQEIAELGWQVWISVPSTKLEAAAQRALESALILMLAVALLTFVIGAVIAHLSSRAISSLLDSIAQLSRGERSPVPPPPRLAPREIHSVFDRFRNMATQVERSRKQLLDANRSLAALVDQRTARLEGKLGEMAELAHLLALPAGQRQTDSVEPTIERFRHLLGLTRLEFEAVPAPAPPATPCHARLAVAFGASNFGTLVAQGAAPLDRACLASLEQLASSLAIVLNVRKLLLETGEQSQTMGAVFESMSDAFVLVSARGRVRLGNPRAAALLGTAPGRLAGLPWPRLLVLARRRWGASEDALRDLFAGRITQATLQEKRGGIILGEFAVSVFEVSDGAGALLGRACLARDITRNAETERLKDNLISVAAHELKTPVTALKVSIDTLAREDTEWPAAFRRRVIADMKRDTHRLQELIGDWLDISRIEAGMLQIEPTAVELTALIRDIERELSSRFRYRLTLECRGSDRIWADPHRLRQALHNLMSNAIRYTDGEAELGVLIVAEPQRVSIAVSDHGTGIAPDQLERIFDKFYQTDMSASRRRGGTGLGLAITRGIVCAHRGRLSVISTIGVGSTFTIELPQEAMKPL